jgi:flagellin-like protein
MYRLKQRGVSAIIAVLLIIAIVLVAGAALFIDGVGIVGSTSSKGSATVSSSWLSGIQDVWQAEITNIGNTPITGITTTCLVASCGGFPSSGISTWYYDVSPGGAAGTTPIAPGTTAYQSDAVSCSVGTSYQFQFIITFASGAATTVSQTITCT